MYIGRATVAHCAASGSTLSSSVTSTKLNSLFYSIWMMSGAVSNTMASLILLSVEDPESAVFSLFAILSVVGTLGSLGLIILQVPGAPGTSLFSLPFMTTTPAPPPLSDVLSAAKPPSTPPSSSAPPLLDGYTGEVAVEEFLPIDTSRREAGRASKPWIPWPEDPLDPPTVSCSVDAEPPPPETPPSTPSPLFMLHFILTHKEAWFIAPLSFSTGMGQGFVVGAWMQNVVAGVVGPGWVGLVGAAFSLTSACAATVWGPLAQKPSFGRRTAFAYAHGVLLTWFLVNSLVWRISGRESNHTQTSSSDYGLVTLLFFATAMFSFVDPVMQAFTSATMQTYFPQSPKLACAVATPRFFYAIGFSCQQFLSLGISGALGRPAISEQCLIQACLVSAGGLSLYYLHSRVRPIDGAP